MGFAAHPAGPRGAPEFGKCRAVREENSFWRGGSRASRAGDDEPSVNFYPCVYLLTGTQCAGRRLHNEQN